MPSPKKLYVSCHYYVLFVCMVLMVFKVNTANIQYFWIFLDFQITQDPLCTAVLTTMFFSWQLLPETPANFQFCWQLNNVYLILWLKVYVAFNDLHHLTTWLTQDSIMWMQNELQNRQPKVGEIHWEKTKTVSIPLLVLRGQWPVSSFEIE